MYKSGKQRSFLFALDKDKAKGVDPTMVQHPPQSPLASPMLNTSPVLQPQIHQPIAPHIMNPPVNPTGIPSLPGLGKLPKFGKIRNSLKGQFKGIK